MSTRIRSLRTSLDPLGPPPTFAIESPRAFCAVEVAADPLLFDAALAPRRSAASYTSSEPGGPIGLRAGTATLYTLDLGAFAALNRFPQVPGLYYRAAAFDAAGGPRETTQPLFVPFAVARRPPVPSPGRLSAGLSWLRVERNRLVDEAGDTRVLRGVVRSGMEYTQPGALDPTGVARTTSREAAGITAAEIAEITGAWTANVVRIPINQEWALTRPGYLADLDRIVALLAARSAYTILALARLDSRRAFGTDSTGRPAMNPPLPEENTLAFWRLLAERYRGQPAVLYDVFSEPHVPLASDTDSLVRRPAGGEDDPAWIRTWLEWVRRIEHVIHRQHERAVVFVSGRRYGLDLRGYPVRGAAGVPLPNTVYAAHVFLPNAHVGAVTAANLDRLLGGLGLADAHPVFVTAWGGEASQLAALDALEAYLRDRHRYRNGRWLGVAGWTAWSWADSPLLVERVQQAAKRGGVLVGWRTFETDAAGFRRPTEAGELVAGALRTMPLAASADFDRTRPRGSRSRYLVTSSGPRRGDVLLVRGHDFTPGTAIEFGSGPGRVTVAPSARLPYLLMVASLPATVPLGPTTLTVVRPDGRRSEPIAVTVTADPPAPVVILLPGAPKANSYTVAFVANPRVQPVGGAAVADPILTQRARFYRAVAASLQAMFTFRETLLHPYADEIRVVARFDSAVAAPPPPTRRLATGMTAPDRANVTAYLAAAALPADVCFTVFRAPAFSRASALPGLDAGAGGADPAFTYDALARNHVRVTAQPGVVALHAPPTSVMTPLHEFMHAISGDVNGSCDDLYLDIPLVLFEVNRKRKASAGPPIPATFARYNGRDHPSDRPQGTYVGRGGIGYAGWRSYGAALIDRSRPNLMDNYHVAADPTQCQLDAMTRRFLRDRLEAKLGR